MGMVKVLKIAGLVWTLLGTGNIILGMFGGPDPEGIPTFGVMFSVALFIIPGLIVYGIGAWNSRKLRN